MKNINKFILILSVVLFCVAGCSDNAQTFDNSSSSDLSSDSDSSTYENPSLPDNTQNSSSGEGSEETSSSEYDYVYFEDFEYDNFTEDDLWLQSFLKENYPMALFLYRTYHDVFSEMEYDELNIDAEHKYKYILEFDGIEFPYYIVPNTYFNTYEEFSALRQKYFSSDAVQDHRAYADVVDTENDRIALRDNSEPCEPQLVEINGRLYHVACGSGNWRLPCPGMMAKIMTKTDDEIVFSYFCYIDGLGNAQPGKGVLKKENGVWKFGWYRVIDPIEFQDIHEVWGDFTS